ncbi:MAG: hypothetical protein AB7E81_17795 [Hyphomicrobiaceae bacterium]
MTDEALPENPKVGRISAIQNMYRRPNSDQPMFRGFIQLEDEDRPRNLVLWLHRSRTGRVVLGGRSSKTAASKLSEALDDVFEKDGDFPPLKQVNGLDVDTGSLVLFENPEKQGPNSSDFYGYYNPGTHHPLLAVQVWSDNDADDRLMLNGPLRVYVERQQVQERVPDIDEATRQELQQRVHDDGRPDADNDQEDMEQAPRRRRGRGR